jgi:hypothetical protein
MKKLNAQKNSQMNILENIEKVKKVQDSKYVKTNADYINKNFVHCGLGYSNSR